MKQTFPTVCLTAFLLAGHSSSPALARAVPSWLYEELVSKSDLVAIVEPIENRPANDGFPDNNYGHPATDFAAINTGFRVHAVLKHSGAELKELTVLHFSYSKDVKSISNGARFVRCGASETAEPFESAPMTYPKPYFLKAGRAL